MNLILSGAKVNWVNEDDEHKTALHQSVLGVGLTLVLFKARCTIYTCHIQFKLSYMYIFSFIEIKVHCSLIANQLLNGQCIGLCAKIQCLSSWSWVLANFYGNQAKCWMMDLHPIQRELLFSSNSVPNLDRPRSMVDFVFCSPGIITSMWVPATKWCQDKPEGQERKRSPSSCSSAGTDRVS